MLPIAVDAMGGDHAPGEIVAGARQAAEELGVPVVLVGRADAVGDTGGLELIEASAMVSAGNTGAAMASALLRMGRIKGVARPAIATPIPSPGSGHTVLIDAGANSECQPEWLVQFAQMGAVFARERYGLTAPRVGLLSIGEEPTKGTGLVKEVHRLLANEADWAVELGAGFIGNVEGRDVMSDVVDVVVTDGFTGNVVLKTLEGALRGLITALLVAFDSSDEAREGARLLAPAVAPLYEQLDPETTGGAMLLGVDGVCIISHGSSSARAIVNAVRVAAEMVDADLVGKLRQAIAS